MNESRIPSWLLPLVAACALLSAGSIYYRVRVESRNKATEISCEIETVENLAASQGFPLAKALQLLKSNGLGSVVLSENTVADLLNSRQVEMKVGALLTGASALDKPTEVASIQFTFPDTTPASQELRHKLAEGIHRRFPLVKIVQGSQPLILTGDLPDVFALRQTSIGLANDELHAASVAGLRIIGRYGNPIGATQSYVTATLTQARIDGVYAFLPQGDQVLGRRDALKQMELELEQNGMLYCSPEFSKLGGDANVVSDIPERVLRLHSAQAAELDKLPYGEAVDRFVRAARERNQRVLLLRPVNFSGEKPLDDFSKFISDVKKGVMSQGGAIGPAKPFTDSKVGKLVFLLLGLAMIGPVWYTLSRFVPWPKAKWTLFAAVALAGLGCWSEHLRMPMAFAGALTFPILAFFWLDENGRLPVPVSYFGVTFISMIGGMCVAGLLNGLPYFLHAEEFQGVKVAVFLPILAVGIHYMRRMGNLGAIMKDPITYRQALLGLVILGALGFMISRTGNDNPAGVSGFELKMRDVLDKILFVRPRTKEFLFGHPALIVGICMLAWEKRRTEKQKAAPVLGVHFDSEDANAILESNSGKSEAPLAGWTALALMLGAVGQTDVVNTLCHIHSPILLAFARIGVGWLAGGILGLVLWSLIARLLRGYGEQFG